MGTWQVQRLTRKIGRNEPCPCGSGKKYKRCCLKEPSVMFSQQYVSDMYDSLMRQQKNLPEPHLHLVPSIEFKGYRFRAIWSKLHYRPLEETFHEFILKHLATTFGEDWRQSQLALPEHDRHILLHWFESLEHWKRTNQTEQNREGEHLWSAVPSGKVKALLQFAYDNYCLQTVNKLPEFLVNRLKNRNEFQGARYEVAVAAIIARAGYDISFLDDTARIEKHCEFIAKNKYSAEEIGVEAKSRRRRGILHEGGQPDTVALIRGDVNGLFRKACSQATADMPFLIFIDLNVLPTPDVPTNQKPWLNDVGTMLEGYNQVSQESPDVFNALALTNFSYYYTGDAEASEGEYALIVSPHPRVPCKNLDGIHEIRESLQRYSHIPLEI